MENGDERKTKDRSPNFPFINLSSAVERARAIYNEERKGAAPIQRISIHWKYSPNSSGLIQTMAALRSYGLLSDEGSGAERRFRLTELALRIILDSRSDSPERREHLRKATLNPIVSKEVHTNWPDGLPSDETLNHYLVLEKSFSPQNAIRAVKILKENQQFSELTGNQNLSEFKDLGEDSYGIKYDATDESTLNATTSFVPGFKHAFGKSPNLTSTTKQTISSPSNLDQQINFGNQITVRSEQVIDPDGVDIRIQFSAEPTEETYEFLKDYVELRLKGMKRAKSSSG